MVKLFVAGQDRSSSEKTFEVVNRGSACLEVLIIGALVLKMIQLPAMDIQLSPEKASGLRHLQASKTWMMLSQTLQPSSQNGSAYHLARSVQSSSKVCSIAMLSLLLP